MTTVELSIISEAASRLAAAARSRMPCPPVRDLIGRADIDAAYMIQLVNIEASLAAGRRVVGRKIGLTSRAVQNQLGVDQPDFGVLLDDMDCTGLPAVDSDRLLQPRIEVEVAFVLGRDIDTVISVGQAPQFVDQVAAAFEIVDSRVADWDISLADTVADNASSGLYVLGDALSCDAAPELSEVEMTMAADGEQVSSGRGSDCLGSPWHALVWLANTSRAYGAPLRAGEVILSGALGPMVPMRPGSTYTASISGLGDVTVVLAARA